MFDLEKSIAEWRQQMLAAGIKPVALEELEGHLREEIEQRMKLGTESRQAFESTAQKIGAAPILSAEFRKDGIMNGSRHWILAQITIAAITGMFSILLVCMAAFQWGSLKDATAGQSGSCLVAAIVFIIATWGVRFGYRIFPVVSSRRTRTVITLVSSVMAMVWWGIFFRIILPHWDPTMSQLTTYLFWNLFVPGGLVVGLNWGVETAFRKTNTLANS